MITIRTSHKIALARVAYCGVTAAHRLMGRSSVVQVSRKGIRWELDLREGIDFSIYLLGAFEPKTVRLYNQLIRPGYTVLDIGANIGAHTLPLGKLVGETGRVIAFEPTEYAMKKLLRNLALNSKIAHRITALQIMLMSRDGELAPTSVYSSWPLIPHEHVHKQHQGQLMLTTGAGSSTLDAVLGKQDIKRVDFVKLDVDGNEYRVLAGGKQTLNRYRPVILMELEPSLYVGDKSEELSQCLLLLRQLGYSMRDVNSGHPLPADAQKLRRLIPDGASRNMLAMVGVP